MRYWERGKLKYVFFRWDVGTVYSQGNKLGSWSKRLNVRTEPGSVNECGLKSMGVHPRSRGPSTSLSLSSPT